MKFELDLTPQEVEALQATLKHYGGLADEASQDYIKGSSTEVFHSNSSELLRGLSAQLERQELGLDTEMNKKDLSLVNLREPDATTPSERFGQQHSITPERIRAALEGQDLGSVGVYFHEGSNGVEMSFSLDEGRVTINRASPDGHSSKRYQSHRETPNGWVPEIYNTMSKEERDSALEGLQSLEQFKGVDRPTQELLKSFAEGIVELKQDYLLEVESGGGAKERIQQRLEALRQANKAMQAGVLDQMPSKPSLEQNLFFKSVYDFVNDRGTPEREQGFKYTELGNGVMGFSTDTEVWLTQGSQYLGGAEGLQYTDKFETEVWSFTGVTDNTSLETKDEIIQRLDRAPGFEDLAPLADMHDQIHEKPNAKELLEIVDRMVDEQINSEKAEQGLQSEQSHPDMEFFRTIHEATEKHGQGDYGIADVELSNDITLRGSHGSGRIFKDGETIVQFESMNSESYGINHPIKVEGSISPELKQQIKLEIDDLGKSTGRDDSLPPGYSRDPAALEALIDRTQKGLGDEDAQAFRMVFRDRSEPLPSREVPAITIEDTLPANYEEEIAAEYYDPDTDLDAEPLSDAGSVLGNEDRANVGLPPLPNNGEIPQPMPTTQEIVDEFGLDIVEPDYFDDSPNPDEPNHHSSLVRETSKQSEQGLAEPSPTNPDKSENFFQKAAQGIKNVAKLAMPGSPGVEQSIADEYELSMLDSIKYKWELQRSEVKDSPANDLGQNANANFFELAQSAALDHGSIDRGDVVSLELPDGHQIYTWQDSVIISKELNGESMILYEQDRETCHLPGNGETFRDKLSLEKKATITAEVQALDDRALADQFGVDIDSEPDREMSIFDMLSQPPGSVDMDSMDAVIARDTYGTAVEIITPGPERDANGAKRIAAEQSRQPPSPQALEVVQHLKGSSAQNQLGRTTSRSASNRQGREQQDFDLDR